MEMVKGPSKDIQCWAHRRKQRREAETRSHKKGRVNRPTWRKDYKSSSDGV